MGKQDEIDDIIIESKMEKKRRINFETMINLFEEANMAEDINNFKQNGENILKSKSIEIFENTKDEDGFDCSCLVQIKIEKDEKLYFCKICRKNVKKIKQHIADH